MAIQFASGLYQVNSSTGHIPTGLNSGVAAFFLTTAANSMGLATAVNTGNPGVGIGVTDGRSSWHFVAGHNDNLNDSGFGGRVDGTFIGQINPAEVVAWAWSAPTFNGSGIAYTEDKAATAAYHMGWWQIAGDAVARCGTAILDPGIAVTGVQTIDVGVDPKMILWASSFLGVTTNTSASDGEGRIFLGITTVHSDGTIHNRCLSAGMTDADNPGTGWRQQSTSLCIHYGTAARVTQYAHAVTVVASGYVQLQVQDTTFTQSTLIGFLALGGANLAAASAIASHPAVDATFTASVDVGTVPGLLIALSAGNTQTNTLTAGGNTIRFMGGFATSPESQSGHGIMWRSGIDYTAVNSSVSSVVLNQTVLWNSLGFGGLSGRVAIHVDSLQAGMITFTCSDNDGNARPFLFAVLSDATPSGGNIYTISETDGVYLLDDPQRTESHTQQEGLLAGSAPVLGIVKQLLEGLFLDDVSLRQATHVFGDVILLDDTVRRDLRMTLLDLLLVGSAATIQTIAGAIVTVLETDGLLLTDDARLARAMLIDDPFLLGSDRSLHAAHTFLEGLLTYDSGSVLRGIAIAATEGLFLDDTVRRDLRMLLNEGVLLDEFVRRLISLQWLDGLLTGSEGSGTRIPASTAAAVFYAVLRAYNPLGLRPASRDPLGRTASHNPSWSIR